MGKTDYKAAIFDVDGTIINGNCSKLLIEYLFEKKLISDTQLIRYNLLIKNHNPNEENHIKMAEEAFSILGMINEDVLVHNWARCFEEVIIPRFNSFIIKKIISYQSLSVEVFLASGSPDLLIKYIAEHIDIPVANIVASSIDKTNGKQIIDTPRSYCIGHEKEIAVTDLLKKRNLSLDQACFYSDNASDISLLKKVALGYWVGTKNEFIKFKLAEFGIEEAFPGAFEINAKKQKPDNLNEYYFANKEVIEESLSAIFPSTCEQNALDLIVGESYGSWDLSTMQKAYFDPIKEYLLIYNNRLLTIGTCIFMEAGGLDLSDHIPLLGISELLNLSNEVFVDITNWTSGNTHLKSEKSHVEISILGNASISLLSLPVHNIIHNRPQLDSEIKLKLFEMYTSIVHNSLFGNGIRLHWEQQNENRVGIGEYFDVAELLNKGLLQFGIDLLRILGNSNYDQSVMKSFSDFAYNAAILIQLLRDKISYAKWQEGIQNSRKNKFHANSNLIGIHASRTLNNPKLLCDTKDKDEVLNIFFDTNSIEHLNDKIDEYQMKMVPNIAGMPFEAKYKSLIESYVHQLVYL